MFLKGVKGGLTTNHSAQQQLADRKRESRGPGAVDAYHGGVEVGTGRGFTGIGLREVDVKDSKFVRTTHQAASRALRFADKNVDKIQLMREEVAMQKKTMQEKKEKHFVESHEHKRMMVIVQLLKHAQAYNAFASPLPPQYMKACMQHTHTHTHTHTRCIMLECNSGSVPVKTP